MQVDLAGTGLIAIDGVFRNLLGSQRILTFGRNLLAYMANGCHRHNNLTHNERFFVYRKTDDGVFCHHT